MPLVAIAVGVIGSMAGAAVGAAIGGTILGIGAATVGAAIGAGLAGGILASATGGSFGKGFLMGAVGSAVGSYFKGFGGVGEGAADAASGATQFADGTTTAGMLAEQGGATLEAGGGIVEGMDAASAMGDITTGADAMAGGMSSVPTPEGGFSLEGIGTQQGGMSVAPPDSNSLGTMFGDTGGASLDPTSSLAQSAGFNAPTPTTPTDAYSMTPGSQLDAPTMSSDYSSAAPSNTPTAIEGINTAPQQGSYDMSNMGEAPAVPTNQGTGMLEQSDGWLQNTFGKSAPSTGKLLMGGGQYLLDKYNIDKQAKLAKGLAPMSFEQYQQQFTNPQDYRNASHQLAQSGRTGTLPALLARMKERARQGYAGYLPGAREKNYDAQAGIQANRNASLSRMFSGFGYGAQ